MSVIKQLMVAIDCSMGKNTMEVNGSHQLFGVLCSTAESNSYRFET